MTAAHTADKKAGTREGVSAFLFRGRKPSAEEWLLVTGPPDYWRMTSAMVACNVGMGFPDRSATP